MIVFRGESKSLSSSTCMYVHQFKSKSSFRHHKNAFFQQLINTPMSNIMMLPDTNPETNLPLTGEAEEQVNVCGKKCFLNDVHMSWSQTWCCICIWWRFWTGFPAHSVCQQQAYQTFDVLDLRCHVVSGSIPWFHAGLEQRSSGWKSCVPTTDVNMDRNHLVTTSTSICLVGAGWAFGPRED